jgi:hypothetical protein
MSHFQSHQIAVDAAIEQLKADGFEYVESKYPTDLDHNQFTINKRWRRQDAWMPCDLTINHHGRLVDIKVYRVRDKAFTSLFRSLIYGIEAASGRPFVQVVVGDLPDFWRMFPRSMMLMPKACRITGLSGLTQSVLILTKRQSFNLELVEA